MESLDEQPNNLSIEQIKEEAKGRLGPAKATLDFLSENLNGLSEDKLQKLVEVLKKLEKFGWR